MGFDEILRRVTLVKNLYETINSGSLHVNDERLKFVRMEEYKNCNYFHFMYREPHDDLEVRIRSNSRDRFVNAKIYRLLPNGTEVDVVDRTDCDVVSKCSRTYVKNGELHLGYLGLDGIEYVYAGVRKGFRLNDAYVGENFYGAVSMVKMKVVAVRKVTNGDACYVLLSNEDGTVRCSSEDIEGIYLNQKDFLNNRPMQNDNTLAAVTKIENAGFEPYNYDGVAYYLWDNINKQATRYFVPWTILNLIDIKIPKGSYRTEEECVKDNKKVKKVRITKTTTLEKEFEESEAAEVIDDPESCDYDLRDSGHDEWKAEIVSE